MHLVVLHHGLWGNPNHLKTIPTALSKTCDDLIFINTNTSIGNKSYDGIQVCGDRCLHLILETLKAHPIDKISFIGYSLGGLILRYVVGRCFQNNTFDSITPLNFITIATPHLGITKTQNVFGRLYHFVTLRAIPGVGPQFLLQDEYLMGLPILMVMAHPSSDFIKALKLFKKLCVFANTRNDLTVSFTTASIEMDDPYARYKTVQLYPETYPAIVTFTSDPRLRETWKWKEIAVVSCFAILAPLVMPLFWTTMTIVLTVGSFKARKRQAVCVYDSSWSPSLLNALDELERLFTLDDIGKKAWMAQHLNELNWEKVHVAIRFANAHDAIVQRSGISSDGNAIKYLSERVFTL